MIVWLASYPRSGNTALRILLKNVFGLSSYSVYDDPLDISGNPAVREVVGHLDHQLDPEEFIRRAAQSDETFLIKTHGNPIDSSKAIYVVRDGRSAIISYHHWIQRYLPGSMISLRDVVIGKVDHGSWSAHYEKWAPKERADTLFLTYEDVVNQGADVISAIGDFLGLAPLGSGSAPEFRDLNSRDPRFFRAGSDAANISEFLADDIDIFWWLHGRAMVDLGYADEIPDSSRKDMLRQCFLEEIQDLRTANQKIVQMGREASELKSSNERLNEQLQAASADLSFARSEMERRASELESVSVRLSMAQDELNSCSRELEILHGRLSKLKKSSWLRLGDKLKLTRALRQLKSDLSSIQPPTLPTPSSIMNDPPEVVAFHAASTARALERISSRGLPVQTVIDVGASNGMWSAVTENFFPNADYLLIEAQEFHRQALDSYCRDHPRASYVLAAAGDQNGEVYFDDRAPFGGVASKEKSSYARTAVPMYSIDYLARSRSLQGPFLLKLDTHGFEVPILKGAVETLKATSLLVIEVYNFRILDNSLLFDEMCAFMRSYGFGVVDVSEPLWRARDRAFWQMDLFFIPLNRGEFSSNSYE